MHWTVDPPTSRPRSHPMAIVGLLLVLLLGSLPVATPVRAGGVHPAGPKSLKLGDDANRSVVVGNQTSSIFDNVSVAGLGPSMVRTYWVNLTATGPLTAQPLEIQTDPQVDWEGAYEFPLGPDNLPPLG